MSTRRRAPTSLLSHGLVAAALACAGACGDDEVGSASATGTSDGSTSTTTTTTTSATATTTSTSTTTSGSESGSDTAATTSTTSTTTTTTSSTSSETTTDATTSTTTTTTTTGGGVCGDGVVDPGEACDLGPDDDLISCCSACQLQTEGVVCRAGSGDMCDPDELCDGVDPLCPADAIAEADTVCGDDPGAICLAPPTCTGVAGEACGEPAVDDAIVCAIASGCSPAVSCGDVDGTCGCPLPTIDGPLTVLITNSQEQNMGHDMDSVWLELLTGLGHDASIVPTTVLDSQAFFAGTDVLIVASGTQPLSPARISTIKAFVEGGKGVYLQAEYQDTYGGNQAFAGVVKGLGVNFAWTGQVVGQLNPVTVSGCLAGQDGCIAPLTYFWYAQSGGAVAPGFEAFLHKNGQDIGFSFCPPDPALGVIVTTTDQDFIRKANLTPNAQDLMENMFNRVARPLACKP